MECEKVNWYQLTQERIQWQTALLNSTLYKDAVSCLGYTALLVDE